jgi:hypothetical protein
MVGVRYLDGVVEQVRGDTLTLRLTGAVTMRDERLRASRAIVVTDSTTRVEGRDLSLGTAVPRGGTAGRWVVGIFALLLLLAVAGASSKPWPDMAPRGGTDPGVVPGGGAGGR